MLFSKFKHNHITKTSQKKIGILRTLGILRVTQWESSDYKKMLCNLSVRSAYLLHLTCQEQDQKDQITVDSKNVTVKLCNVITIVIAFVIRYLCDVCVNTWLAKK